MARKVLTTIALSCFCYAQFTIHDRLVLDSWEEMGVIPGTDN